MKAMVETLVIENALTLVKVNVLCDMVLGVYFDTLPPEPSQAIEEKFKNVLKAKSEKVLQSLKATISDQKKILRYLYDLHEANL